jgi:hypothetical protein
MKIRRIFSFINTFNIFLQLYIVAYAIEMLNEKVLRIFNKYIKRSD